MPVLGMPYSLQMLLEQLQEKGTMSSWQIYEEKSGNVCVKLRFECSGDQPSMDNIKTVSYKKKSQKQMDRDLKRAQNFEKGGVTTRSQNCKSQSLPAVELPRDYLHSETMSDLGSMACSTPAQVEHVGVRSPVNHDSPVTTHLAGLDDPYMDTPVPDVNKQSADHDHGNDSDTSSTDQGNDSVCNVKRPLPKDEDNSCSLCGISPGMCWRRCTHTDHTSPFNICNICYHDGNSHSEHEDQLNMYYPKHGDTCPLLCDSCGTCFHTKTSTVIKCEKCAHMYLLCNDCFKSNRHKGHAFHMVKICAGQL